MPVVINEFEVLPSPAESKPEAAQTAETPAKDIREEIREAVVLCAEREFRLRAY
jgi:hypothetical protein